MADNHGTEPPSTWRRPERAREAYVEIGDKARHNVRYGSLADIVQRPRHVCFTTVRVGCRKSARSGRDA